MNEINLAKSMSIKTKTGKLPRARFTSVFINVSVIDCGNAEGLSELNSVDVMRHSSAS